MAEYSYNKPAKVEDFKLSKEQLNWVRAFQRLSRVEKALKSQMQLSYGELEGLQKIYAEAAGQKIELLRKAPIDKIKELPGQEEQ